MPVPAPTRAPWLVAGLLLLGLVASPLAEAATTKVLTISTGSAGPKVAFKAFDANPPKVFDFNGDGKLEIVAQNDNRYVYVFDSKTGKLLAEMTTKYPTGWGARPLNGPEAAVLVKGSVPHLIVANSAAYITDFKFSGVSNGKFLFTKVWEKRLTDCHSNPGMDSKVTFADLDKDGDFEILAQTEEVGVYALRNTGSVFWKKCIGGGNAEPSVGDLDGDGGRDVVFSSDGGKVTAVNGKTGATKWTFWVGNPTYGLGGGAMPVGATVARLDSDAKADVIVGVRDSSDCTNFNNNHATLFAIRGSGSLMWRKQPADAAPLTYTHPIVSDVDNNGQRDVLWATWNTQGHKCGAWQVVGTAKAYRFDAAGNQKWSTSLNSFWHNKDMALADVDADGTQELLANGPNGGHDGIWYLNSKTGAKEAFVSTWPWKVTRGPIVADLWKTGKMQWVVPVSAYGPGTSGGAIQVFDTGVAYNSAWPHLPYPKL